MTRGYFLVVQKDKIVDGAYLSSDAYPAYYGVKILQAIMDEKTQKFIDDCRLDAGEEDREDLTKVSLSEFIKSRKKGDTGEEEFPVMYPDYTYILYQPSLQLKVFYYGESIYQVKKEDFPKALFAFKNEFILWSALSIDETTCIRSLDGQKELNKLIRSGVSMDFLYGVVSEAPAVSIDSRKNIRNRTTIFSSGPERVCRVNVIAPAIRDDASLDWDDWDNMDEPSDVEVIFRDNGRYGYDSKPETFYPVIQIGKLLALDVMRKGSRHRTVTGALSTCHKETAVYIKEHQQELLDLVISHELMKKGHALMMDCSEAGFPEDKTDAALAFAKAAIERIKGFPTSENHQIENAHNKLLSILSDDVLNIYGVTGRHESGKE